jgi:hypothetical protein
VIAQLVQGDDVGVLQTRDGARFAQEALAVGRVRGLGAHDLQGHVAVERFVAGAIEHAHGPLAAEGEHTKAADVAREGHEGGR